MEFPTARFTPQGTLLIEQLDGKVIDLGYCDVDIDDWKEPVKKVLYERGWRAVGDWRPDPAYPDDTILSVELLDAR